RELGYIGFVLGGAVWLVNGLFGLSAANGSSGFYVTEVVWLPVHALLGVGIWSLLHNAVARDEPVIRRGLQLALFGRVVFFVGELVAIAVANGEIVLFPIAALSTAVGMTMAGVGVARSARWGSWRRVAPLATGLYPFVAMFPLLAITGERPNVAVSLWGLTFVATGVAFARESVGSSERSMLERHASIPGVAAK
ncbi:MAG: hypothetical protein Q8K63_12985, partial [Acidimicrobiales bacterium]|nr:hypothetical protein [Acidimicrobiales bacterium]